MSPVALAFLLALVTSGHAQDGRSAYRQAVADLTPVDEVGQVGGRQEPRGPAPDTDTPYPRGPAPDTDTPYPRGPRAGDEAPDTKPLSPRGAKGGKEALRKVKRDLLDKFDQYMFDNLEAAYFRLNYAIDDAARKTLAECGCTIGDDPLGTVQGKPADEAP